MPYKNPEDAKARYKRYYQSTQEEQRKKSKIRYSEKKDEIRSKIKEYYKANPDKIKDTKLRSQYGISLEEWNYMYQKQNGRCAICRKQTETLVVDHDHESGAVRGLLCNSCNSALGFIYDDISIIEKIKSYLSTPDMFSAIEHEPTPAPRR